MEKWICSYCNNKFLAKNRYTKSGHLARCSKFELWKNNNLTKDVLHKLYIEEERSLPEIRDLYNLDSCAVIYKRLKKYNIKIRSIKEATSSEKTKNKRRETHLFKYGSPHNFCKNHPSRKQMEKNLYLTEGIVNVFQRKLVKEKIRQSYKEKYGTTNLWNLSWYRKKIFKKTHYSSIHRKVFDFINITLKIKNSSIEYVLPIDEHQIYLYDIFVPNNFLIEIHGDYWHCNPAIYKENDVFYFPEKIMKAKDKWKYDYDKTKHAIENGYKIITLWEKNIKYNWEETVSNIKEFLELP